MLKTPPNNTDIKGQTDESMNPAGIEDLKDGLLGPAYIEELKDRPIKPDDMINT